MTRSSPLVLLNSTAVTPLVAPDATRVGCRRGERPGLPTKRVVIWEEFNVGAALQSRANEDAWLSALLRRHSGRARDRHQATLGEGKRGLPAKLTYLIKGATTC